jgi:hypothetical protein
MKPSRASTSLGMHTTFPIELPEGTLQRLCATMVTAIQVWVIILILTLVSSAQILALSVLAVGNALRRIPTSPQLRSHAKRERMTRRCRSGISTGPTSHHQPRANMCEQGYIGAVTRLLLARCTGESDESCLECPRRIVCIRLRYPARRWSESGLGRMESQFSVWLCGRESSSRRECTPREGSAERIIIERRDN